MTMIGHLKNFDTEEGRLKAIRMRPRPDDVFVVTPPKCGTTWVQQIVHQLRSRGSMDFVEISDVVPWIELAQDCKQDIDADHAFAPRAFKTHLWYNHCPKGNGSKHIVVYRNPLDVCVSFYKFFEGWFFPPGDVSLEEFVRFFFLRRGEPKSEQQNASYFFHLLSWWPHRHDESVLFLFFEDLKEDLPGCVDRIAKFIGVENYDEQLQKLVVSHSTFAFMAANEDKFDEKLTKMHRNGPCGLPADAGSKNGKVREGQSGAARASMSPELAAEVEAKWEHLLAPPTGLHSYHQLRAQYHSELKDKGR